MWLSVLLQSNVESTVYALLAGFQNFGSQMARTAGVAALGWFSIRPELSDDFPGEPCNFNNMPCKKRPGSALRVC